MQGRRKKKRKTGGKMETRSERRNTISSVKGRKEKVSVLQDKDNVRKKINSERTEAAGAMFQLSG